MVVPSASGEFWKHLMDMHFSRSLYPPGWRFFAILLAQCHHKWVEGCANVWAVMARAWEKVYRCIHYSCCACVLLAWWLITWSEMLCCVVWRRTSFVWRNSVWDDRWLYSKCPAAWLRIRTSQLYNARKPELDTWKREMTWCHLDLELAEKLELVCILLPLFTRHPNPPSFST
jgi:hypothetical protein